MKLVLASASPRRKEILTTLGVAFTVRTAEADETCDLTDPGARVEAIARRKCDAVWEAMAAEGALDGDTMILASDTLVTLDGEFLGKPADEEDAFRMLSALSGVRHHVFTGVTVRRGDQVLTRHEVTSVDFRALEPEEVEQYIATGECMDKAGAYGIQGYGCLLVEGIVGDYYNVMGLPVALLAQMLRQFGVDCLKLASKH